MEKKIIALGFFDGVHLGHQALLAACRQLADQMDCIAAALTFTAHPDGLVSGKTPALLNTPQDREYLLREQYHMDQVIFLPFNRAMMRMPWKTFFRMLLIHHDAAGLVCGADFRFGSRGEGNAQLLAQACAEEGIPCLVVPQQKLDGVPVSSTHIRALLEAGALDRANAFLGHPHRFTGTVVPGKGLGRTLGIPTANLILPRDILCPRHGVYACKAIVEGKVFLAVTNVGTRPTVSGGYVTVEPWILDFDGDLYGKTVTLEFHSFLRPEQKFDSLEALREEILKNARQTREFFQKK